MMLLDQGSGTESICLSYLKFKRKLSLPDGLSARHPHAAKNSTSRNSFTRSMN
ncbi:MAG: hypothetical protein ACLQPD_26725 [Desulfomonilaceae bacterium]